MQTEAEIKQEVLTIHDLFWKALGDRDTAARYLNCVDNITFIGTGLNEKAANKEEYIAINTKGIQQYPQQFTIHFLWKRVSLLDDIAWVESEVEWELMVDGRIEKEMIRNTVILKKKDNSWKIVHVHGSVPDYRYTGQNYMSTEETQKRNRELEMEVYKRTRELNEALEHLKDTLRQLIQSEKMASLGELTAGIAHEIQNPLNFVNNFSEVNAELIDELKAERSKPVNSRDEKVEDEILKNLADNLEKISQHGKRAEAIVKGMLQHSHPTSGQKHLTDVNALTDEYLRLCYHGSRAKDKSFNAAIKTDFNENTGSISIVPQDIGRVILNLLTNAFYAVNEKKKSNIPGYEPTVIITTSRYPLQKTSFNSIIKAGDGIIIKITDNGNGMPQRILDKIFQPFFTTKPAGQGTGLGLSLSYDIIKAHGGELQVKTNEGEGTEFTILLPA